MNKRKINSIYVFFVLLWTIVCLSIIVLAFLFKERSTTDLMLHEARTITKMNVAFAQFIDSLNNRKRTDRIVFDSAKTASDEAEVAIISEFKNSVIKYNQRIAKKGGVETSVFGITADSVTHIESEKEQLAYLALLAGEKERAWLYKTNNERHLVFLRSLYKGGASDTTKLMVLKIIVPSNALSKEEDELFRQTAMIILGVWLLVFLVLTWLRRNLYRYVKKLYLSDKALVEVQQLGKLCSWEKNCDESVVYYTHGVCDMLCVGEKEIPRTFDDFAQYVHPDDRKTYTDFSSKHNQAFSGRSPEITYRIQVDDTMVKYIREYREIEVDGNADPVRARGIVQDITTEWIIEEKMREARQIYQNISMPIFIINAKTGVVLETNSTFGDFFDDQLNKTCKGAFGCDDDSCKQCPLNLNNRTRSGEWELQHPASGHWFHCMFKTTKWSDGTDVYVVVMNDVTSVKQANAELIESEARFRSLFDATNVGQMIVNRSKLTILEANRACNDIFEYNHGELISKQFNELLLSPINLQNEDVREPYAQVSLATKKNSRKLGIVSTTPLIFKNEKCILVEITDITGWKKAGELM